MKKLIAMIGAVAMSFGLFAATASLQTSFETGDGVEGTTWTPGTGWTWTGNPLTVNTYDGDAYEYPTSGQAVRRTGFADGTKQEQYIKLETGKDTLVRECADGDLVLDQLVQFTGFEEMQESFGEAKIAIWKASMADDDDVVTNANLYVTVGSLGGSVSLSLGDTYEDNKWYRLTIKSIKNIMTSGTRAGFLIYIDGQQVASVDAAAADLFIAEDLTPEAAALMAEKKLFPAMTATDATFASVGYMGIGAIDDVVIDDEGPLFVQTVDFTVSVPTNFKVVAVTNLDTGAAIELKGGKYTAGTGANIGITVAANGPVVMNPTQIEKVAANGTLAVTADDLKGKYAEAEVSLTRDTETTYFTKDGFEALLLTKGAVVDGDVITVLKAINKISGGKPVYSFTAGVRITIQDVKQGDVVTACKWFVYAPNYTAGGLSRGGAVTFNLGIEPEKQLEVSFEDETNGKLTFSGTIGGEGAYLKIVNGKQTLSGITLVGDAKVYVKEQLTVEDVFTNYDEIKEEQDGGFYIYSVQQETGFAIIIAGDVYKYFPTLQAAINAAGEGEYADYKTVTIVDNFALDTGVVVDKEVTIDFNGKTMTATYATTKDAYVPPINVLAGGDLTIKGNGSIVAWDGAAAAALDSKPVIRVEGALTYLNGTLTAGGAEDCGLYGVGIFNGGSAVFGDATQGPSITSWFAAVAANNLNAPVTVTINNGSYTQLANGEGQGWSYFCGALYAAAQGTYTINGGTFDGALYSIVTRYNDVETVIDIEDGTFNDAMLVGEVTSQAEVKGTRVVTKDEEVTLALAGSDHYWFDGTTLGKKSDAVAKIDDDYFMTLPKAIAAAEEDDTVTLLKNIELSQNDDIIVFPATFKGTLDLGGKTIERTAANHYVIQVLGDLTITGTGLVKFQPLALGYTTSTSAGISGKGNPSSMIDVANDAVLTIAGGTFQTDYCCVKTEEIGELSITGGKFEILPTDWQGLTFAVMNWGDAEITGGDFDGNVQVCAYTDGVIFAGKLKIDGGTFQPATVYLLSYNDDAFPVANVLNSIAENFTDPVYIDYGAGDGIEPTTTVGDEYTTYTLAPIVPQEPIAQVTIDGVTTPYTDLHEALVAGSAKGSLVELIADVDLAGKTWEPIMSFEGTFDGKDHIISNLEIVKDGQNVGFFGEVGADMAPAVVICNVTFNNANVTATSSTSHGIVVGNQSRGGTYSNITVTNSTIHGVKYCAAIVGYADGGMNFSNIVVKDNTIDVSDAQGGAICGYSAGPVTVDGAEISGNTITGGTGGKLGALWGRSNNATGISFIDVVVDQPNNALIGGMYAGTNVFTGEDTEINVNAFYNTQEGSGTASIQAGTWTPDPTVYVPEVGYEVIDNKDGTWTVQALAAIALTVSAENATVDGIEDGTVYKGSNLTFKVTANTGYKLVDVKANGAVLEADDQGNYTYEVTGEETEQALEIVVTVEQDAKPVNPEEPKQYNTPKEAADAAKAINDNKETMIITPPGAVAADYTALFTAVVTADNKVVVELNENGTNTLAQSAEKVVEKATGLGDSTATTVTITPAATDIVPGFYYGLGASTEVAGEKVVTSWQQATTEGLKEPLTANKPENSTKGFFQVRVSVRQQN